ncbi:MAG: sigma-70 family RNA polymerase sigma factor [Bacteroidia bacterium]
MKPFTQHQIEQCKKGDRAAQKHLFESLYAPMFRVCQRYVVSTAEAEDCLMRGMMKVFQQMNTFNYTGEHSLFMWVRKVMVNESLMELRKKNNFYLMPEETVHELPDQSDVLQQMAAEDLYRLILQLPEGYRTVLNLFVVEGYSHKEIAEMLGIQESTSKTQYMKAKARLKELISINDKEMYGTLGK